MRRIPLPGVPSCASCVASRRQEQSMCAIMFRVMWRRICNMHPRFRNVFLSHWKPRFKLRNLTADPMGGLRTTQLGTETRRSKHRYVLLCETDPSWQYNRPESVARLAINGHAGTRVRVLFSIRCERRGSAAYRNITLWNNSRGLFPYPQRQRWYRTASIRARNRAPAKSRWTPSRSGPWASSETLQ